MDDFNFLKDFARNLDREQPIESTEKDWEKLADALDRYERNNLRRRRWLAAAFPVFSLLVLAGLGFWLWRTSEKVASLETELAGFRVAERTTSANRADVDAFQTSVVRFDTVFRTVWLTRFGGEDSNFLKKENPEVSTEPKSAAAGNRQNAAAADAPDFLKKEKNGASTEPKSAAAENRQNATAANAPDFLKKENPEVSTEPKSAAAENRQNAAAADATDFLKKENPGVSPEAKSQFFEAKTPLAQLSPRPLPTEITAPARHPHLPKPTNDLTMTRSTATKPPLIKRFRPHQTTIGLTAGAFFFNDDQRGTVAIGLSGQQRFGRRLALTAGAEVSKPVFLVKKGDLDQNGIPPLAPPQPGDELKSVQVWQPVQRFSLGLRWYFLPDRRVQPFLSGAWLVERLGEQTLRYEFENLVTEEETHVNLSRRESYFKTGGLRLGTGVALRLSRRWSVQLEGGWQQQFSGLSPQFDARWNVGTGIFYRF